MEIFGPLPGHMKLVKMVEYFRSMMSSEVALQSLELDQQVHQPTLVAVLCPADFSKGKDINRCQHWVPAWLASDVPELSDRCSQWLEFASQKDLAEMSKLESLLEATRDEVLRASLRCRVDLLECKVFNRSDMFRDMRDTDGLLCCNVVDDGNCGLETVFRLEESLLTSPTNLPNSFPDIEQRIVKGREGLKCLWESLSSHPVWQELWRMLCKDMVDLKKWKEDQKKFNTPPRKKRKSELPFTPDDPEQSRRKLVVCPSHANSTADDAIVVPAKDEENPAKKRRTGKPAPIQEKINFDKYFSTWISDLGITYRSWFQSHKSTTVIV